MLSDTQEVISRTMSSNWLYMYTDNEGVEFYLADFCCSICEAFILCFVPVL